jgi:hypothetical protein
MTKPRRLADGSVLPAMLGATPRRNYHTLTFWYATDAGLERALAGTGHERSWRPVRLGSPRLLTHNWVLNEFGIAVLRDARPNTWYATSWSWDHEWPVEPPPGKGKRQVRDPLIADALLTLERDGEVVRRWVEIDRTTANIGRIVEKLRRYEAAYQLGEWQRAGWERWPALTYIVGANHKVPDHHHEVRVRGVLNAAARLCSFPVLVARFEDVMRRGPAADVWQVAGEPDRKASLLGVVR